MGNMETYLAWRGDLSFTERPFCEVDNIIFTEITYFDLEGIVPTVSEGGSITLAQMAESFFQLGRKNVSANGPRPQLMELLATSTRFRDVRVSRFSEQIDEQQHLEFAAMTFSLETGTDYVAFRGTGDLLVGWREDFNMTFLRVPAQVEAAAYLEQTLSQTKRPSYVGGHSKGGNLAVYAAMMCPEHLQENIVAVYNNDGPGFCDELIEPEKYQAIEAKLIRIVPEFCVFGNLFNPAPPTKIIASSASGMSQHSGLSWQVEGDHFCEKEDFAEQSKAISRIIHTWIRSASLEQREAFVDDFFKALEAEGVERFSELTKLGTDRLESILISLTFGSEKETKTVAVKLIASIWQAFKSVQFVNLFGSEEAIYGVAGMLLGIFFMISPPLATKTVGIALGSALMFFIGRNILRSALAHKDNERIKRIKLIVQLISLSVVAFMTAVLNLIFHVTNLIVGVFFLVIAFSIIKRTFSTTPSRRRRVLDILMFVLAFVMGIVPIVSSGLLLNEYAFLAGSFFTIYGAASLVYAMYRDGKMRMQQGEP